MKAGVLGMLLLVLSIPSVSRGEEPAVPSASRVVPVARPLSREAYRGIPILQLWRAEREFRAGRTEEALSRFLDLAYNFPDEERKGYVWLRVGEILLAKGEIESALSAADKAFSLSRARFLALSAMDLKFRLYQRLGWKTEARQVAAYLVDQQYIQADPTKLLVVMARADAEGGKVAQAMEMFRRAVSSARTPEEEAGIREERDALIEKLGDIPALRDAAESEEDPEVKGHLFLVLGKAASRMGFTGMGGYAFERAARSGGEKGKEAAEQLYRLDKILSVRPKIVGILPLSGKLADVGFSVMAGAEVALHRIRKNDANRNVPVLQWVDTGGAPDRARREFLSAASEKGVVGFLGPLTGEEGRSVGVAFGPKSPPVLYLGQKGIPEKPFLYGFGLSPYQEARAVLSQLQRNGRSNILMLYPDNGYGKGFWEAVSSAARESGMQVSKAISYDPDTRDFTGTIRKATGAATFNRDAMVKEKGKGMKLKQEAVLVADRWDRVFLLASQLRYYNVYLPLAGFSGWNDEELIRKAGESLAGAVFSVDYADAIPGRPGENLRAEYRETIGASPSRFEAMGFDGAAFLADAFALDAGKELRTAGETTRDRIPKLKTFHGATGTFQFGPSGDMRRKVSLLQVELGNFVPVPDF